MARVLIADDSAFVRLRLARLIEDLGHQAILVEDGAQAVLTYETTRPDLVFMDIAMPFKDGITATREILLQHPDAVIVLITGLDYQDAVQQGLWAGAKYVIAKPIQDQTVIEVLNRFLNRQVNGVGPVRPPERQP